MSKGISSQQLDILGLAAAVSRLRNGQPMSHEPKPHPYWKVPVVVGTWRNTPTGRALGGEAQVHITTAIAAHCVGGIGLRREMTQDTKPNHRESVLLETTASALSTRSSISRAIGTLLKRGMLAHRPLLPVEQGKPPFGLHSGCVLTASGLAIGLLHEKIIHDLDYRLWLLQQWKRPEPITPDWTIPTFLQGITKSV
jgi:hypothetical protein